MSKNITKLISPRVLCTSIKNRVPSWFDVLRLITIVRAKMSQNSYLREYCAQVSQIVFLADFTVLGLFTTAWGKLSQNSFLHEFCAQVSQIVFVADLIVLRLFTTVWAKMSQNSYLREFVHNYHKSCSYLIWPFYGLLELYEQKNHNTQISASSVHKYQKSCS